MVIVVSNAGHIDFIFAKDLSSFSARDDDAHDLVLWPRIWVSLRS